MAGQQVVDATVIGQKFGNIPGQSAVGILLRLMS